MASVKIVNRPPRLQWIVRLFFPGYDFSRVVGFAFGDTIYTRFDPLPDYNLVHEKVHLRQMRYSKLWGVIHFIRFALSRKFRYKTEVEAYGEEYRFIKNKYGEKVARQAAEQFADILSGQGENAYVYGKTQERSVALEEILSYN